MTMYNASTYFRKKVTFFNMTLTFLIVLLHAKSPERWGLSLDMQYPLIYITTVVCQISIPLFFFISGLLFYKNCTFSNLAQKLKTRVRSLLIPYLLWNVFFVGVFYMLIHVPFFAERMNMGYTLETPKQIVYAILNSRYTVLWFVKVLIIYNLFSPLFLLCLQKMTFAVVALLISILVALFADYGYESVIRWLPIYIQGAIVGRLGMKMPANPNRLFEVFSSIRVRRLVTISMTTLFFALFTLTVMNDAYLGVFRFLSPILIWVLADLVGRDYIADSFKVKEWMSYMFFIYCTHHFVLNVMQKFCAIYFTPTALVLNLTYIITPVITVFLLIWTARYLSQFTFYKYLSGGR